MALTPEDVFDCLRCDISDQFGPQFFDNSLNFGPLWPGMSLTEAAGSSIVNSLIRKSVSNCSVDADSNALQKFLHINEECKNWRMPDHYDTKTEILIGELKRAIYEFWFKSGPSRDQALWDHPFALLERGRIGPGANLLARGGDFYTKFFSSKLTCSSPMLYKAYKLYIQRFTDWSEAENFRYAQFGEPSIKSSNRLSFVPKNDEISRCICIEPTLNTFFQLGAADILNERLFERFGISLSKQQFKNRNLARLGSLTDGLSTIDLSSASDSISVNMLAEFLPPDFFRRLMQLRCNETEIKGRGTVALNMISTMGNGYTFPLQCMLFACTVVAALRFRGLPCRGSASDQLWGVNGDDIIVPSEITGDVISLLALLGFSVNHDKTFVKGPFRESCGSDFFLGSDIRGVYLKELNTIGSRYSAINQLLRFSTKTGVRLSKTVSRLLSTVPFYPVPRWENADSGIHAPLSIARPHLRWDRSMYGYRYRYVHAVARRMRVDDSNSRIVVPGFCKPRIFNPHGLMISFLQGSVHSMHIGVRQSTLVYRTKRRITSSFDCNPVSWLGHPDYGLDWQAWEETLMSVLT